MVSNQKLHEIKKQIEYYLSDENLAHDQFFHTQISSDAEGYLDLDLICSCNKVKKALWSKGEIISGIELSKIIELSPDKQRVRRKGNPPLPEFTLLGKKTKKDKEADNNSNESLILTITSDKPTMENWKGIEEKFKELNPNITVLYARFKETEGNFGIIFANKGKMNSITWTQTFELNDTKYEVIRCEGSQLAKFWKDHGSHLTICTKPKPKKKNKGDDTKLSTPVVLGDSVFYDIGFIKNRFKKIIASNVDGERLSDNDQSYILDLLHYHQHQDKIVKDLDYITTGKVDEQNYSRCFFAIKKDGKKEEFALNKCVERLLIDNRKNSKKNKAINK